MYAKVTILHKDGTAQTVLATPTYAEALLRANHARSDVQSITIEYRGAPLAIGPFTPTALEAFLTRLAESEGSLYD